MDAASICSRQLQYTYVVSAIFYHMDAAVIWLQPMASNVNVSLYGSKVFQTETMIEIC